jgi:hypothetical protein
MAHGNPGRKVAGHLNDRHDFHFFMCFPALSLRSETAFQPATALCEAGFFCPDFRTGLENARRCRTAAPGAGA